MRKILPFVFLSKLFFVVGGSDITTQPKPGLLLVGGGTDVDEGARWFVERANGGDLLVLRARGGDAYNQYFFKLGKLNSAQTIVAGSESAARSPFVVEKVKHAEAIFLAGGDQWNYLRLWKNAPLGDALRDAIHRGVPVGGTSAGLAVLGEYVFSAEHDTVTSAEALRNPYDRRVTIAKNFVNIPALRGVITDSHFSARDRMGRTLVFLARMMKDFHQQPARAIAIDERTAALLEPAGSLRVAGAGHIYFLQTTSEPTVCRPGEPLTLKDVEVYRAPAGATFNTLSWRGAGGVAYTLDVANGIIESRQPAK